MYMYPKECAASMARTMRGWIGVLFKTCTMSSMVFPCEWSSYIILSCEILGQLNKSYLFCYQERNYDRIKQEKGES